MALRAIFGTDRIPTEQGNYNPSDAIPGTPLVNIELSATNSQISRTADGYLQVQGNYNFYASSSTVTKSCGAQLPLKKVVATLHDKLVLVFGIRVKVTSNNTGVHLKLPNADGGTTFTMIGDSATWPAVGELGPRNSGKEFYVEIKIDVANKVVYRRLDGASLASVALPDAFATRFANNQAVNIVLGYPLTYSESITTNGGSVQYKDGYLLEKSDDGILSDFLGPQLVKPIVLTAFDAPAYTNNGSSITNLQALNTAISTSASRSAPLVTTDTAESTATAKFTVDTTAKINAVQLFEEVRRLSGSDAKLKMVVSDGQNSATNTAVLTDTITQVLGYQAARALDGTPWTKAKLEALTVRLTPVSNQ